jgi:hypothetical protein
VRGQQGKITVLHTTFPELVVQAVLQFCKQKSINQ